MDQAGVKPSGGEHKLKLALQRPQLKLDGFRKGKPMSEEQKAQVSATITGDTSGQIAVGNEQTQVGDVSGQAVVAVGTGITQTPGTVQQGVTEADLAELRRMLAELEAKVEAEAPSEQKQAAVEHVKELGQAITAGEPDLTTMEYVKRWFGKHVPGLAGAVTGVVIHPIVGKIVEAAGEALAAEFRRRFGIT